MYTSETRHHMKALQRHLGIATLLLYCAAAQTGTTTLQSVGTLRDGENLRVEIDLSAPIKPTTEIAIHPDRILLDFPGTANAAGNGIIEVNANGVRQVRIGRHSETPLITRVVIDLDHRHPYTVTADGNRILVTIAPADNSRATRGAPVAATTGNLIAVFRKRHDPKPVSDAPTDIPQTPAPPPAVPSPAFEPPAEAPPATASVPTQPTTASPTFPAASSPEVAPKPGAFTVQIAGSANSGVSASTPTPASTSTSNSVASEAATAPASPKSDPAAPVLSSAPSAAATALPARTETSTVIGRIDDPNLHTVFKVKYVADGVVYLDGGKAQGLSEGMKLEIVDTNLPAKQGDSANAGDPRVVAELEVTAVAEMSAVTDFHAPKRPVKAGDLAYLSQADAEAMVQQRTLSTTRQYPAVISFTESDELDEEARQEVPRPPLPSVNRARGRIGFDTIETFSHGTSNVTSTDVGMVFRGDITRIGGTYWNLSGYWRGELTKASAASQQTLQNLLNRTYHLNMTYDNPNSTLVAGFGRLYLPWAPSLDTIDGGYFGKRLSKGVVLGVFGGSTPDPSSWDYSPNRVIGGSFVNFEGGEYNGFHYSSTSGAGVSMVNWQVDRPFIFFEDSLSYKRTVALYESAQLDDPQGNSATPSPGPGLGRNFLTLRVDPHPRMELNFNYNYFRDIPTFDPTLIGTGLLDKYLFQGFSAGGRVDVWKQIWLSTNIGQSNGTGDSKTSLNQMYGITFGRVPKLNLRADLHYAKFNSSFGNGSYESFALSRQVSDRLRLEVLLGQQKFASAITTNTNSRFITGTVETMLGPHYYLQSNFTTNRGDLSYDQMMFSIGYRFDSKRKGE